MHDILDLGFGRVGFLGPHSKFVSPVAVPSLTVDGVIQGLVAPWIVLRAIGREKYNGR